MSIPLDRLYHYIDSIAQNFYENIIIYRFTPHGSKKIEDLCALNSLDPVKSCLAVSIFCNDQEPLDYYNYSNLDPTRLYPFAHATTDPYINALLKTTVDWGSYNLRSASGSAVSNIFDQCILLHSEQRSKELENYQKNKNFVTAYYWNHGFLALDWFRYAQHISIEKTLDKKLFLIYNRAWTGTREYRLKLADLLIDHQLIDFCNTTVGFEDSGIHYSQCDFKNPQWQPNNKLESFFQPNSVPSTYSADFDINDYASTDIEIVLETLFDDQRLQLTEKTLRPIACEQPFILCATHGSLEYLKQYGFKTFHSVWNEEYDQIVDPGRRLQAVIDLMKNISNWTSEEKHHKLMQLKKIAQYNKNHFFSKEFYNILLSELKENLNHAMEQVINTNTSTRWLNLRKQIAKNPDVYKTLVTDSEYRTRRDIVRLLQGANQYLRPKQ